jgi:CubicO group peptidase (beta-lactamase class C family)
MKKPQSFFKLALILLFSFLYQAIAAQQNVIAQLNSYFNALYQARQFNGNVLVAEKGKIIYERSFGYADFSAKKPNTKNTSFPVASITKTFTSTAILQLQERGKLGIGDRFVKYFPGFPYPSLTIKQLLSHTSRLPSPDFYRFLDSLQKNKDTFFTNNDVIPALIAMKKPLLGLPKGDRSDFSYSNLNYYLLALLIEKLSGMPYGSYIKKNIFMPAGMEHSSLSEFYFGLDKNLCREQKYRFLFSDIPERIDTMADNLSIFRTYNFKGHGDIVSTVEDLLKYDQALYNGTLLKENSTDLAYQVNVPGESGNSGYGLGWSIAPDSSNGKIVLHHGGGIGIEAMLVRNIARHQTIILFDNTKNFAFNTAMNALDILNGKKTPLVKPSAAKLYGKTLVNEGIPAARILLKRLRKDTLNYLLTEDDMNVLAYQLMWNNINEKAMEVFQTNLELFSDSWNSYDSYGEILVKMGRKEEAIKMYKRSIELNPKNEGGKKALEQLLK